MVLLNDGDIEGASQQVERALQLNPAETEAHYYRGVIARQHGDLPGAIKEMEIVVAANSATCARSRRTRHAFVADGESRRRSQGFRAGGIGQARCSKETIIMALAYSRLGLQDKAARRMAEFPELRKAADSAKAQGSLAGATHRQKTNRRHSPVELHLNYFIALYFCVFRDALAFGTV